MAHFKRGDWVTSTGFFTNRARVKGPRETQPGGRESLALTLFWDDYKGDSQSSEFWWYEDELVPLDAPEWDDSELDDAPTYQQQRMFADPGAE